MNFSNKSLLFYKPKQTTHVFLNPHLKEASLGHRPYISHSSPNVSEEIDCLPKLMLTHSSGDGLLILITFTHLLYDLLRLNTSLDIVHEHSFNSPE